MRSNYSREERQKIVEEYINEVLVGDYKEEGATGDEVNIKKELQKHFAGKLRGIRKHEAKKVKGAEKEAKKIYGEIKQQEGKVKEASDKLEKTLSKVQKARQDYQEAKDGTQLKTELGNKWDTELGKMNKAGNALKKQQAEEEKLVGERGNIVSKAADSQEKANKANQLMGGGAVIKNRTGNIAYNGTKKHPWERN